jgi:hypothetical protein
MAERCNYTFGYVQSKEKFESFANIIAGDVGDRAVSMRRSVDLRQNLLSYPIQEQRPWNSCAAHAALALWLYNRNNVAFPPPHQIGWHRIDAGLIPSRAYVYNKARTLMQVPLTEDSGCSFSSAFKVLNEGAPPEFMFQYCDSNLKKVPDESLNVVAQKMRFPFKPLALKGSQEMKTCLSYGAPFVVALTITRLFLSDVKKAISKPPESTQNIYAGHAMLCVGFNKDGFILRNSWGAKWRDAGHCMVSTEYMDSKYCGEAMTLACTN